MADSSLFTTTTASDYAKLAKQYTLPNQKKTIWEEYFLDPTKQYYAQQAQQVRDIASYDISEAYANYRKQQLQLAQQSQLATGYKEAVGESLGSAYSSEYSKIKTTEAQQLAGVEQKYQKALSETETAFSKYGETAKQFEEALLQYGASQKLIDPNLLTKSISEGGYGVYEQSFEDGALTTTLTDYGKDLYDKILHSQQYSRGFVEYLSSENPELYEAYTQNQDFYNAIVAGLEHGDRTYDTNERNVATAQKEIESLGGNYDALLDLYGNKLVSSREELRGVVQNLARNPDYVDVMPKKNLSNLRSFTGSSGVEWKIMSDDGIKWVSKSEQPAGYRLHDIVYVDGEYRYIDRVNENGYGYYVVRKK